MPGIVLVGREAEQEHTGSHLDPEPRQRAAAAPVGLLHHDIADAADAIERRSLPIGEFELKQMGHRDILTVAANGHRHGQTALGYEHVEYDHGGTRAACGSFDPGAPARAPIEPLQWRPAADLLVIGR